MNDYDDSVQNKGLKSKNDEKSFPAEL